MIDLLFQRYSAVVFVSFWLFAVPVFAADGDLDISLTHGEILDTAITGHRVIVDGSGNIYASGEFTEIDGHKTKGVAKFKSDGTIDTTFSANIGAKSANDTGAIAMALQSTGKLVIGGQFLEVDGQSKRYLARLNTDGSLDTSFNPNLAPKIIASAVLSIFVDGNDKVIFSGRYYDGVSTKAVSRLNSDGTTDVSFSASDVGANSFIFDIDQDSNGNIYIGGLFTTSGVTVQTNLARLTSTGAVDATFTPTVNNSIIALAVTPNDDVVIGGNFGLVNGESRNRLALVNADGSVDMDFDPNVNGGSVSALAINASGDIAVGGSFTNIAGANLRAFVVLDDEGALINVFSSGFIGFRVPSVQWQANGQPIMSTQAEFFTLNGSTGQIVARKNTTGGVDDSLAPQALNTNAMIRAIAQDSKRRILIGGSFKKIGGIEQAYLARLLPDGEIDQSFTPSLNNIVQDIAIQRDNKVVAVGSFTMVDGNAQNRIVRFNQNGSVDSGFDVGSGANQFVEVVKLDKDGSLLIGGSFSTINGTARSKLARLNSDGSLNADFIDAGLDGFVHSIIMENDDVLIAGSFRKVSGQDIIGLARLSSNGVVDTSLDIQTGGSINAIATQRDGTIIIGGNFSAGMHLKKLTTEGNLETININSALSVYKLLVQPDDKIIVGLNPGTQFGGSNQNGVARLNKNGTIDDTFDDFRDDPASLRSARGRVFSLAFQQDGKLLVGGTFLSTNLENQDFLVRLETGLPPFGDELCVPIKTANNAIAVICI